MSGIFPSGFLATISGRVRKYLTSLLVLFVRIYQATLSPIIGGQCRFVPSCSHYFIESVQTLGPIRGLAFGLWRIVRCNPFCKGGYDPVPQQESHKAHGSADKKD